MGHTVISSSLSDRRIENIYYYLKPEEAAVFCTTSIVDVEARNERPAKQYSNNAAFSI
jgi:hypothetical protein